jgi:hypothetical protein
MDADEHTEKGGESGLPVLDGETFHSFEFTDVVRNEDRAMDQARPDAAVRRSAMAVEGQRPERRQEFLEFG